jgi:hypothetical protein
VMVLMITIWERTNMCRDRYEETDRTGLIKIYSSNSLIVNIGRLLHDKSTNIYF